MSIPCEKNKDTEILQESRRKALGMEILENCRNELYSRFPYLDGAFAALPVEFGDETNTICTDGCRLCGNPAFLMRLYVDNPEKVRRGYLHILLHCLYLHILPPEKSGQEIRLWNLACDIFAEWILWRAYQDRQEQIREECFRLLNQQKAGMSAEGIELLLREGVFGYDLSVLEEAFSFDDHDLWHKRREKRVGQGIREKWEKLLVQTARKQGGSGHRGSSPGCLTEHVKTLKKSRYDYRKFLKRFAVMREEMELDQEMFDYIPYDYGFRLYGNLPMIEPLEYREVNRLQELVIAIDTSGSCSGETVGKFLEETYAILSERENFFRKFRVYLIQCDCFIQDVRVLRSEEEWKACCRNIRIQGRSGTDFRPVFELVEDLRQKKELRNLKALIYFTDGDGIYPAKATEYETAFVFLKKNEHMEKVPKWAVGLVTEDEYEH